MRSFGDLTIPSFPAGTTIDPNAQALLVAQVNALPLDQQQIFCNVADQSSEGASRKQMRLAMGAAGGLAIGVVATLLLKRR